jgi:hypothetical protein
MIIDDRKLIGVNDMSRLFLKYWKSLVLVNLFFSVLVVRYEYHHLYSENALLENLQGAFLLLSAIAYFSLARLSLGHLRSAYFGTALLCFSFFTREVDLELLPVIEQVGFLFHGIGRTAMLLVLWSFYIVMVVRQGGFKAHTSNLLRSKYLHYFSLCFLLLITGAVFDREIFNVEYGRLFEELAETNAYAFLALPAIYELYYRFKKGLRLSDSMAATANVTGNVTAKADET